MEAVYEELDNAKAEIEKLSKDLKRKVELSENLKKAHNEQLVQIQEASLKIERHVQEINMKAHELSTVKQMCEDLQSSLNEKESIIRRLSTANDKLRADCNEKSKRWEEEKRGLVLALDEANEGNIDQEQKIHVFMAEIEGLKGLLSGSQKKCLEAEKNAKAFKELRDRDDMLLKLEEENQKVEDQLKWKKEQFKHLEEAHEKLRGQFRESKKEWELEKFRLVDEICNLQESLNSQIRISDDLQSRLKMCNQALAHEESRRKCVEIELSEFKARFENVFSECQETKTQLECLTTQRDKEIAVLRNTLGTKGAFYKETEYRAGKLEQENKELLSLVKELQEAQIQEVGNSSSLAKLRSKLKSVEQMHRECSANLRAKEAEWSSEREKLSGEMNYYMSALENKETAIKELEMKLDNSHSAIVQLKLQNEASTMILALRSEITEAQLNLSKADVEKNVLDKEKDEEISLYLKQMELENNALTKALTEAKEENEKAASLLKKEETAIKQLEMELGNSHSEIMQLNLQNEEASIMLLVLKSVITEAQLSISKAEVEIIDRDKQKDEISLLVKQLEMKNALVSKALIDAKEESEKSASLLKRDEHVLQETRNALSRVNSELAAKICDGHAVEFERWIWKSIAQRLKDELEENQSLRKELEASLLVQVEIGEAIKQEKDELTRTLEVKDSRIDTLMQQIEFIEQELKTRESDAATSARTRESDAATSARTETMMSYQSEKDNFLQIMQQKDKILEGLQNEIEWLEQESLRRELAGAVFTQIGAERTLKHEKENLIQVVRDQDQRIDELLQHVRSLEEKFNSSLVSLSSQLAEKQAEITFVHEAWEKITAAEILALLEVEEKKLMIVELDNEICLIQKKLEWQEKSLIHSRQQAVEVEAELEAKQLEMNKLTNAMELKLRASEVLVDELKSEKINLVEDVVRLSSERENLMGFVLSVGDRINQFSSQDLQLMGPLERMLQSIDNNNAPTQASKIDSEPYELVKENTNTYPSPTTKKSQAIIEERSPFRELN